MKLYLIRNYNLKSILSYDIIVPKANKLPEFIPLIQFVEKELENLDKEEDSANVTEEELKDFVDEYAY